MFEIVITVLFLVLLAGIVRMTFQITWGVAKAALIGALALVLPALIGCFLVTSGMFLLMPFGLMVMAFGVVRACI